MKPEILFLKYAFPCTMIILQRKEINQKTFDSLEKSSFSGKPAKREVLEKVYFRAISRMKALAKEKNRDYFSEENIRDYFVTRHNEILDGNFADFQDKGLDIDKNAPPALKHLCKVFQSTIIKKGFDFYIVEYADNNVVKTRPVSNAILPDAELGDVVTIHYGYAIEKVS
ncbi:MAG TPA: hypothetical protein VJC07_00040 [Candidatus Nanoarchaeia archaeon]|nr:hypothetical protein [Candidatus Nanoarchaeia archaeon]